MALHQTLPHVSSGLKKTSSLEGGRRVLKEAHTHGGSETVSVTKSFPAVSVCSVYI